MEVRVIPMHVDCNYSQSPFLLSGLFYLSAGQFLLIHTILLAGER